MRKNLFTLLLLIFFCSSAFAQGAKLKGTVVNSETKEPLQGVSVRLSNQNMTTTSESDGSFYFENVKSGDETLIISSPDVQSTVRNVSISQGGVTDAGEIAVVVNARSQLDDGSLNLLDESSVGDDDTRSDANIASLLTTSNDVYLSNMSYNMSAVRFRLRGYDTRYTNVYINGVNFNDQEMGNFGYSMIGGLNDATRNQDDVIALTPGSFSFGAIGGATNINTNPANYAPGKKVSLSYSNRMYKVRGMATYSTGLMNNGWAFTGSVGYRWADEGFVPGTFYNSLGIFLSAQKVLNAKHSLTLTAFGSPTQRGQQMATVQEAYDLMGTNLYNPNWGWQNGKKRNARIVTEYKPTLILSHDWKINDKTKLTTGLSGQYIRYGGTALNWHDAQDPRPDYYRNMPSYQSSQDNIDDYTNKWQNNTSYSQVNWDRLYSANALEKMSTENGSIYMVEERRNDQMNLNLNSTLNHKISENVTLTAGVEGKMTKGMHFKTVNDLLGGDYFLDVDQFAQRDFGVGSPQSQNDLNNPDHHAVVGDIFGYNYNIYVNSANIWFQNIHRYKKWDIYYGAKFLFTDFWREGKMRNGLAPDNSFGKGTTYSFVDQAIKGGITYKLSGKHIFSANISYSTAPPLTSNAYLSQRIKDNTAPDLKSEKIFSADVNYNFSTPNIRGRLSAFQTNFYDQMNLTSFYYDASNTFVNYALSGIDKMYRGVELGLSAKINTKFSVSFAGTLAEYIYTNRPTGTISYENGTQPDKTTTVYYKNFYVGGTPQSAGTLSLHYFYKYWFFDLNGNAFGRNYIELSPARRTPEAIDFPNNNYEEKLAMVKDITNQEEFGAAYTVDFSIGKVLYLSGRQLNINLQFCNILNNTNIKTGGYEQGRFDFATRNVNKFTNKYYYAQGFNCFLMAGYKF